MTVAVETPFSAMPISAICAEVRVRRDPVSSSLYVFVATTPLGPVTGLEIANTIPVGTFEVPARMFCAVALGGSNCSVRVASRCAEPLSFWSS